MGYGLEDRLTDAQSSVIINQVITPAFKTGNFNKGISDGVAAMLVVLGGSPLDEPAPAYSTDGQQEPSDFVERHPGLFVFLVILFILTILVCQMLGILPTGGGGSSRSGGSGGGFGGGGGGGLQRWRWQFRGRRFVGRLVTIIMSRHF
nr:hypothetical protein GCM10020185_13230 [Pseudomonas brassicacearum subsp. brassicacearum]